jgi:hypothetical protein
VVYLASTRDYNTGTYHHDGLASRFKPADAAAALEEAHKKAFTAVAALSLEELVEELEVYANSAHEGPTEVLRTWEKLEPYRIAVPLGANPAVARLFVSNIRLAVAVLQHRQKANLSHP